MNQDSIYKSCDRTVDKSRYLTFSGATPEMSLTKLKDFIIVVHF